MISESWQQNWHALAPKTSIIEVEQRLLPWTLKLDVSLHRRPDVFDLAATLRVLTHQLEIPSAHDVRRRVPDLLHLHGQGVAGVHRRQDVEKRQLRVSHVDRALVDVDPRHVQLLLVVEPALCIVSARAIIIAAESHAGSHAVMKPFASTFSAMSSPICISAIIRHRWTSSGPRRAPGCTLGRRAGLRSHRCRSGLPEWSWRSLLHGSGRGQRDAGGSFPP